MTGLLSVSHFFENNPEFTDQTTRVVSDYQKSKDKSILIKWIEQHSREIGIIV
jgi:hypothetical protein